MVIIVAILKFIPENLTEIQEVFTSLLPEIHKQSGCLLYSVNYNTENMVIIEKWQDEAALHKHWDSDHFATLFRHLDALLIDKPEIYTLEELKGGDPAKNIFTKDY